MLSACKCVHLRGEKKSKWEPLITKLYVSWIAFSWNIFQTLWSIQHILKEIKKYKLAPNLCCYYLAQTTGFWPTCNLQGVVVCLLLTLWRCWWFTVSVFIIQSQFQFFSLWETFCAQRLSMPESHPRVWHQLLSNKIVEQQMDIRDLCCSHSRCQLNLNTTEQARDVHWSW